MSKRRRWSGSDARRRSSRESSRLRTRPSRGGRRTARRGCSSIDLPGCSSRADMPCPGALQWGLGRRARRGSRTSIGTSTTRRRRRPPWMCQSPRRWGRGACSPRRVDRPPERPGSCSGSVRRERRLSSGAGHGRDDFRRSAVVRLGRLPPP